MVSKPHYTGWLFAVAFIDSVLVIAFISSLQDLSSNFIPFDDDEEEEEVEEEEETYDDIERATTPPPPRLGAASAQVTTPSLGKKPQNSREEWKDQTLLQEDEEDDEEDIYEILPGKNNASQCKQSKGMLLVLKFTKL